MAVDFGRGTGKNGTIETRETLDESASPLVVAGTIGQSTLVDELVAGGKLDVSSVVGKWKAYTSALVENSAPGISWALIIAGSDHRGTT